MKIIVTTIPASLVTSKNQKQESNFQEVSDLVTRNSFTFCL